MKGYAEEGFSLKKAVAGCFSNDLGIHGIGDPFVLKVPEGSYYLYCTSAPDGFYCWRSEDLVHWTDRKMCYTRRSGSWGIDSFWAPEVVYFAGSYYMYYTARNAEGSLRIGLAISNRPDGPFLDNRNEPFFDFGYAAIDANILIDEDGSKYLYYSRDCSENTEKDGIHRSEIYGIRLREDMLAVDGEAVRLLTPEQTWELESGDPIWNEGPEMIKHEGRYYLSYSGNCFASSSYSLGYAVASEPLGPFVKAEENPILSSHGRRDVSGPGHHSFTWSPDGTELWVAYHSHTFPDRPDGNRKVNIDRAGFTEKGKLCINGPLTVLQPMPSGAGAVNVTGKFRAEAAGRDAGLLVDGFISAYGSDDGMEQEIPAVDGAASVILTASEPVEINRLAVFPGQAGFSSLSSLEIVLDNEILSKEYVICDEESNTLILDFPTYTAKKIEILFRLREGEANMGISEIMLILDNSKTILGNKSENI
ncbi:glycoside hydrolase family 43 protein [Eisenbergiella sp.]